VGKIMKKFFVLILISALFFTACQGGYAAPPSDTSPAPDPDPAPPAVQANGSGPDMISDLIKDEYDGIEITVNVLERMAIIPGAPFQATVLVENKGDKTVSYIQGSGSYNTPQALFLYSEALQTVRPQDHLGLATADFVTQELKPGESLLFKLPAMAIAPNTDFDGYTFELFDEGIYIPDMDWSALQERFPGLVALAPGDYALQAYFLYNVSDGGGEFDMFGGPTGYAVAETIIGVS